MAPLTATVASSAPSARGAARRRATLKRAKSEGATLGRVVISDNTDKGGRGRAFPGERMYAVVFKRRLEGAHRGKVPRVWGLPSRRV